MHEEHSFILLELLLLMMMMLLITFVCLQDPLSEISSYKVLLIHMCSFNLISASLMTI